MNNDDEIQKVKYDIFRKRVVGNFLKMAILVPFLFITGVIVVIGVVVSFSAVAQITALCLWIISSAIVAIYLTEEE